MAAVLLAALFAVIGTTQSAFAAGERYTWKNGGSLTMSGGALSSSFDLFVSNDIASGTPKLSEDSNSMCVARVTLYIEADGKTAKIGAAGVNSSVGGGKAISCSSSEESTINAWKDTTVTLTGSRDGGTETAEQKEIGVSILSPKPKNQSPASLKVALKNSGGNTVKEFTTNIGTNGNYYGEFRNVNPGTYTVCVDKLVTKKCESVTKVKFERATARLGEYNTQQSITVDVEANVTPTDPAVDQTYGPFSAELKKGSETVKTEQVEILYAADGCRASQERGESCGGSITAKKSFEYGNVDPGNYTVCIGARCVEARKVTGVPLAVTLAISQDDIDNVSGEVEESATTCAIDNIGWLICPVLGFMSIIVDQAYGQVASWLGVTPLTTTTTDGSGTSTMYSAWSVMRNIANLAFVIAFMFIIYSQLTSAGISNYGIKKLLPKIIVAAVLVNVSYWLCAIAVDLSNIAGASLYRLFDGDVFSQGIDTSQFEGDVSSTGNGWTGIVATLLASAAIWAALPALIVALPTAIFAIVTVFLVLALRQVLIILLVVISPLAFVALLLPNTEDYFKKWRSLFQTLLLLYPIIAAIFGASAMASAIVMSSATDEMGDGKIAVQLMGALITVLPLAITPLVLKFSGGVLARFGGMVNNPNKGPFDAMRKRTDAFAGRMRNRREANSIDRGQKFGAKVRDSSIGRRGAATSAYAQDFIRRKAGDKMADRYGRVASRASNGLEYAASMGATGKVDAAERDKYAKVAADAAARGYVADRAVGSAAYARSLAGGNAKMGQSVQDYAVQAQADERVKDIKAASARIANLSNATVATIAATGMHNGEKASADIFAAATHRIQETGSFDERKDSLAYLASLKDPANAEEAKRLNANATLRGEAAQRAIGRGDGDAYGPDFANRMIDEGPSDINAEADFAAAVVKNAANGSLNGGHLVKNNKTTKFIVDEVLRSGDAYAMNKLRDAAIEARASAAAGGPGITGQVDEAFRKLGV